MTYEYLCLACGYEWEAEQRISEQPLRKCPKCRQDKARRQVSGGQGFILKGGGWYADGYARSGNGAGTKAGHKADRPADSDKTETTKTGSDSGGKSDGAGKSGGTSKAAAA